MYKPLIFNMLNDFNKKNVNLVKNTLSLITSFAVSSDAVHKMPAICCFF